MFRSSRMSGSYRTALTFFAVTIAVIVVLSAVLLTPLGPSLLHGSAGPLWPRAALGCACLLVGALLSLRHTAAADPVGAVDSETRRDIDDELNRHI